MYRAGEGKGGIVCRAGVRGGQLHQSKGPFQGMWYGGRRGEGSGKAAGEEKQGQGTGLRTIG